MRNFLEKFGCLSTILLVVVVVILCKKVDWFCYHTHEPVEYCRKFPSGKYQDEALQKILNKLRKDAYYFNNKFENQRGLAAFIQNLSYSPLRDSLEVISMEKYELVKAKAGKIVFTADFDWKYVENSVEDKYKPEIASIRADLERRWQNDSSAWDLVCSESLSHSSDERRLIETYLSCFPDGEHALEANEILVSILEDELEEYESYDDYDPYDY